MNAKHVHCVHSSGRGPTSVHRRQRCWRRRSAPEVRRWLRTPDGTWWRLRWAWSTFGC